MWNDGTKLVRISPRGPISDLLIIKHADGVTLNIEESVEDNGMIETRFEQTQKKNKIILILTVV